MLLAVYQAALCESHRSVKPQVYQGCIHLQGDFQKLDKTHKTPSLKLPTKVYKILEYQIENTI